MGEVEEVAEERAGRESESALEVREEDDPLASARIRHDFGAGSAPLDLGRHLAGMNQSTDVIGGGLGSLPAASSGGEVFLRGDMVLGGGEKRRGSVQRRRRRTRM